MSFKIFLGEWTTILVSKKTKKQKPSKKDGGHAESAFEVENEQESISTPDAAAASASITSIETNESSPLSFNKLKKKKKDKPIEKVNYQIKYRFKPLKSFSI